MSATFQYKSSGTNNFRFPVSQKLSVQTGAKICRLPNILFDIIKVDTGKIIEWPNADFVLCTFIAP